jgi:hypothetical protein
LQFPLKEDDISGSIPPQIKICGILETVMNKPLIALLSRLSYGETKFAKTEESPYGFVETLARVYERARNALEYRADNLVRRAAIERILRRRLLLNKDPKSLADNLLTELRWAKYLSPEELKGATKINLERVLEKYTSYLHGILSQEWIAKIASAEIEELFNLNTDYNQFTLFAFQIIRQKVAIDDENLDLLVYFAVDKVYAGCDDEQIAYHILKLAGENVTKEKLEEAWRLFMLAKNHKALSRIIKFVRRQMPPLILLRDIYFYYPQNFREVVSDINKFQKYAEEVLENQLEQMSGQINTAAIRSVVYVFLTKMVLAIGLETPFEIFIFGHLNKFALVLNMIFPPFIMWVATTQIRLPSQKEKTALINRTWYILQNFDLLKDEEDILTDIEEKKDKGFLYWIFSILYAIFFVGVFAAIFFVLGKIGYRLFSELVFIFFLTVIAFFAYRINQTAKIYSWKENGNEESSLLSILSLPILAIGSRLSVGLSKLNFLAFILDFILEAPFKLILGFVDNWVQFLSFKKEEQIIE